jgi:hypothetical protein
LEKPRGLNAKCPKLDFVRIVFLKETRGPPEPGPWLAGRGRWHRAHRSFGLRPLRFPRAPAKGGGERGSGVRGVWWAAHRGASGGVAAGHRGGAVAVRKIRWLGIPARERRREKRGEVWSAPRFLGWLL